MCSIGPKAMEPAYHSRPLQNPEPERTFLLFNLFISGILSQQLETNTVWDNIINT